MSAARGSCDFFSKCTKVKAALADVQDFVNSFGIDLSTDDVACEFLVKNGRVIGCQVGFEIPRAPELELDRVIKFVEGQGYGRVYCNGSMTKVSVQLSLSFV